MIIGYTTGVFDLFHIGHLKILNRAKKNCDFLIVGVTTDDLMMEYKKKTLANLDVKKDYEEIDTRLASGWYVDDISKKKIYKTNKTSFKISKKINL